MSHGWIILGAGGHGRVLLDAVRQAGGGPVLGFTDADDTGREVDGVPVLGDDAVLAAYPPESVELVNGLGSVRDCAARRELYLARRAQGFRFARVIHPAVVISPSAGLGAGVQIMAGVVVQTGCRVGENVLINTGARVDHDARLAAHCHVATGAVLAGGVQLGEAVHIGAGAVLIQGISVGAEALIAAGAVVVRDVPAGALVRGVPAR